MQTAQPKYAEITIFVYLNGPDGNAFSILGCIQRELKRLGVPKEERDQFIAEATSGDYDHLLATCREWVTFETL